VSAARIERAGEGEYSVVGELSFATVGSLHAQPIAELTAGASVVVHLEPVTRTDSAGLALLLEWTRGARAAGGEVAFSGLPPQLVELIRVCGLDGVLTLKDDGLPSTARQG
jgi:phospholipid transport system transporter-binding protein